MPYLDGQFIITRKIIINTTNTCFEFQFVTLAKSKPNARTAAPPLALRQLTEATHFDSFTPHTNTSKRSNLCSSSYHQIKASLHRLTQKPVMKCQNEQNRFVNKKPKTNPSQTYALIGWETTIQWPNAELPRTENKKCKPLYLFLSPL